MLEKINDNFKSTKIAFKTLGCKLNFSETSEISRSLDDKILSTKLKIDVFDKSKYKKVFEKKSSTNNNPYGLGHLSILIMLLDLYLHLICNL